MKRNAVNKVGVFFALLGLFFSLPLSISVGAQSPDPLDKIEPALFETLSSEGSADAIVRFSEQADLTPAYSMSWEARGAYVYSALQMTAERSQRQAKAYLNARGIRYRTFIAGNELYVWGADLSAARALAALPEVSYIRAPRTYYVDPIIGQSAAPGPETLDWGIVDTGADDFWATFGFQGDGIVVANIDTGVQWNHPALDQAYKCASNPTSPACWYDPSSICGGTVCDNVGHGTHTMGTMVGDDDPSLAYQVGMAPNALWIACKGCEYNSCSDFALNACADWVLAPAGNPANRPHVVNNSWGGGGCNTWYQAKVQAWRAAGIFPAFSAGNSGSGCNSLGSPGDYQESFGSAAHDVSRNIAYFSSRGPSCFGHDPYTKPNISAPGVNVCSSVPTNGWDCTYSGTSMASPHSAGAVALLWSCNPSLIGQIDATFELLQDHADPPPAGNCGAPPDGEGNYTYGYGYLNVYNAGLYACVAGFGYLDGHVYDATTNSPIPGATVTAVRDEGGTWTDDTDATGYYTMNVAVGTFDVTASHPHYTAYTSTDVSVVTDTVTTVNFYLVPRGRLFGYVTDYDNGTPIEGAIVTADDGTWDDTDATGYYEMYLDEGTHVVTATMENYAPEVATVNIVSGEDTQQDFALQAAVALIPSPLHVTVPWQSTYTDQATLLNRLPWGYDFEFIERPGGFIPAFGSSSVRAQIPATEVRYDPAAKGSEHAVSREAREVTFSGGLPSQGSYDVLLVSPDSTMGDISSLLATLAAFPDLNVTVWDNYQGNPTADDLAPYQVVIFGNDYTWESAGLDKVAVGNALADYIDNGGKVIESLYAQSCFDQWGFGGRYMTDGYSPFTCATTDYWNPDTMSILQPTHPVMQGVTSIQDFWGHQNPGLRTGAELLASWSGSGYNAVAVNENVVALNQLIFHSADWAGDVGTLLHNAIVWLAGAGADVPWFGQEPISGTVPAEGSLQVTVAFSATYDAGVNQPGDYYCTLRVWGEPALEVPVTMTVLPPADMGKVEGYVTDSCTGDPLEGVHIAIAGGDPITETWTDASGHYAAWLVPGTYNLDFTLDAYLDYSADVTIVAGEVTTLDVNLVPDRACIAVDPTMFEFWVVTGTQASDVLSIINNGGQDLNFGIFELSGTVGFLQFAPASAARVTSVGEAKVEGASGGAWPDDAGGPDPFGYTFADSDEPGGPAFDWIEISGTGQNLGLTDDSSIFPLDLPFTFNFYGQDYNQIAVGSNGTVYFVDQYLGLGNVCLPGDGGYGVWDFIAGMWDDLNPSAAGAVYYQALNYKGTDVAVVEWYQVPHYGTTDDMTYEIVLFSNGSILIQYLDSSNEAGSGATVGIQGYWQNPSYYLEYSCNTASLHNDLAICFTYPGSPGCVFGMDVPWVWEEPVTGTVPAQSSLGVDVTVTSYLTEPLPLGTYTATLIVSSNADEGTQYVPVIMHIIAEAVAPTADFQSNSPVVLGETAVFTFTGDLGLPPATDFHWDFGDGFTSTLKNPTHVYGAVGVYTVTLEVCNMGGCDTATGFFEVVWPFHIYLPIVTKGYNP